MTCLIWTYLLASYVIGFFVTRWLYREGSYLDTTEQDRRLSGGFSVVAWSLSPAMVVIYLLGLVLYFSSPTLGRLGIWLFEKRV